MNILLTGGTGFIGSPLVESLAKDGHKIICIVRNTSKLDKIRQLPVSLYEADLTDKKSLGNLPVNIDFVYHLAAHVAFSTVSKKALEEMTNANVRATENLFLAVVEKNPNLQKFIHFSSLASVGFQRGRVVDNSAKAAPDTLYGKTKYESEVVIKKLAEAHDIPLVILRPSLVYGKNDFTSDFLKSVRLINKGVFPIFGSGGNIMSPFIFGDDLITIAKKFMNSQQNGCFICANDEKFTVNYFVSTISEKLGKKFGGFRIPIWLGQSVIFPIELLCKVTNREAPLNRRRVQDLSVDRMFNDIHKDLDEAINYYPKINLKAGADIVVDWCRENNLI